MRQYQPIWIKLKSMPLKDAELKGVSITANRLLHTRIIKAVVKEKWLDLGYKIQTDPRKTILTHEIKHSVLTFKLHMQINTIGTDAI